jgi:hypothetical protein
MRRSVYAVPPSEAATLTNVVAIREGDWPRRHIEGTRTAENAYGEWFMDRVTTLQRYNDVR